MHNRAICTRIECRAEFMGKPGRANRFCSQACLFAARARKRPMPSPVQWTPEMDDALRSMRGAGASWSETAARIGVSDGVAVRRAEAIGIPRRRMNLGQVSGCAATTLAAAQRILPTHVARITGTSVRTIQKLAAAGAIPGASKFDGIWTFDPVQVTDWWGQRQRSRELEARDG